jgi:hypothetical protein
VELVFKFRLVGQDGERVKPETFVSMMPSLRVGEQLFINPQLRYRIVEVREGDETTQAVLVVQRE